MAQHNLNISRHQDLFEPHDFKHPVTIIGAGSTGSWLALALAKLGITDITVWDFDTVEEHNIPNQAFALLNINETKAHAIAEEVLRATGTRIRIKDEAYVDEKLSGIVFLMVDSMAERKRIWEGSIKMKSAVKHLIEPRLGLDVGRVYNVDPMDLTHIREYEKTYYSDEGTEVSACGTSLSVISSSFGVVSWCVRQLINFHNKVELDNEILIDFKFNNLITQRW